MMADHMNDLGNLLGTLHKLVSNPAAGVKLLDDVKAHIRARDEAVKATTDLGNQRRQMIAEKEDLAARMAKLISHEGQIAKSKTSHDHEIAAHKERVAQFGRDRQEFDVRMSDLTRREGALKQRDAALQMREGAVEKKEAELSAKLAKLRELA